MNKSEMEELKSVLQAAEEAKEKLFSLCESAVEQIITNKIRDLKQIDSVFDQILGFVSEEQFNSLYWRLLNYLETFDESAGAEYRRIEELLNEGE
ncbi:MAG: hypothetical protein ACI4GX_04575 [Ruminococcus sp.]